MGLDDEKARWEYNCRWLTWHLLYEIWAMQGFLAPGTGEDEDQEERTRNEHESPDTALPLTATSAQQTVPCLLLEAEERHLLVQLRLLSELIPPPPAPDPTLAGPTATPYTDRPNPHLPAPNLDSAGLAASPSVLDGLLTLATGVAEVMTGFHIAGGIAAMLHGAFRIAAPDSPLTQIAATCRKALTPDLTVIQESVKMMAPLPENERSGLRDVLCFATYQITGTEVSALKHQLFGPGDIPGPPPPRRDAPGRRRTVRVASEDAGAPTSTQDRRITDEEITRMKLEMSRQEIHRRTRGIGL